MAAHARNGTWRPICDGELPAGRRPIGSRMLFKLKRNAEGDVVRHKCRLVAQGFSQRPGIDYEETFAPTAKWTSTRIALAMAATEDLDLHQLDVDTAFLLADLEEELYMRLPSGEVVRLLKAIYGLKQASRAWASCLRKALAIIGFRPSQADPSLFIRERSGQRELLVVYVDDMLLAVPRGINVSAVKAELRALFPMKDLGEAHEFLGLRIERDRLSRRLWVGQGGYTRAVLERFGYARV